MARHEVVSPIPGVFYRRPDPDSAPFTDAGAEVGADDPVCVVEVMKSFHQVPAGAAGIVLEFLVQDEEMIDAGQVVAVIEAVG